MAQEQEAILVRLLADFEAFVANEELAAIPLPEFANTSLVRNWRDVRNKTLNNYQKPASVTVQEIFKSEPSTIAEYIISQTKSLKAANGLATVKPNEQRDALLVLLLVLHDIQEHLYSPQVSRVYLQKTEDSKEGNSPGLDEMLKRKLNTSLTAIKKKMKSELNLDESRKSRATLTRLRRLYVHQNPNDINTKITEVLADGKRTLPKAIAVSKRAVMASIKEVVSDVLKTLEPEVTEEAEAASSSTPEAATEAAAQEASTEAAEDTPKTDEAEEPAVKKPSWADSMADSDDEEEEAGTKDQAPEQQIAKYIISVRVGKLNARLTPEEQQRKNEWKRVTSAKGHAALLAEFNKRVEIDEPGVTNFAQIFLVLRDALKLKKKSGKTLTTDKLKRFENVIRLCHELVHVPQVLCRANGGMLYYHSQIVDSAHGATEEGSTNHSHGHGKYPKMMQFSQMKPQSHPVYGALFDSAMAYLTAKYPITLPEGAEEEFELPIAEEEGWEEVSVVKKDYRKSTRGRGGRGGRGGSARGTGDASAEFKSTAESSTSRSTRRTAPAPRQSAPTTSAAPAKGAKQKAPAAPAKKKSNNPFDLLGDS